MRSTISGLVAWLCRGSVDAKHEKNQCATLECQTDTEAFSIILRTYRHSICFCVLSAIGAEESSTDPPISNKRCCSVYGGCHRCQEKADTKLWPGGYAGDLISGILSAATTDIDAHLCFWSGPTHCIIAFTHDFWFLFVVEITAPDMAAWHAFDSPDLCNDEQTCRSRILSNVTLYMYLVQFYYNTSWTVNDTPRAGRSY